MKTRSFGAAMGLITAIGALSSATGCGTVGAHVKLRENTESLIKSVNADPTLPRNQALFCLDRAIINYNAATYHSNADTWLLGASAVAGLAGVTFQAMGAAWPLPRPDATGNVDAERGTKKNLQVVGLTAVAIAAGMLAVRTAAGQSDIALAQRTAAAKQVDTAIALLAKYALAEDPKDVDGDGFSSCRDADLDVAKSYPGATVGDTLRKQISEAQAAKDDKKKEASEAKDDADKAKKNVEEAKAQADKKDAELAAAVKKKEQATTAAARDQADKEVASLTKEKATLDAELARATQKKQEVDKQTTCKDAKVEVADRQVAMLKAAGALRRATFFQTKKDVELANGELRIATEELKASRSKRDAACQ